MENKKPINKNVTRKDVAEKANVSVSVVSRAINNSGYVDKEKKQRILKIAEELGYAPNPVAMALQRRQTHQLLLLSTDLTGACFNQMYHGMARQAQRRGYRVLASINTNSFDMVKNSMVDGILFNSEGEAKMYAETVGKNYYLPCVTASFLPGTTYAKTVPSVIIDNHEVVNSMIDYLMNLGHKKIGMVIPFNDGYANDRYRHWKQRMMYEIGDECMNYLIDSKDYPQKCPEALDYYYN